MRWRWRRKPRSPKERDGLVDHGRIAAEHDVRGFGGQRCLRGRLELPRSQRLRESTLQVRRFEASTQHGHVAETLAFGSQRLELLSMRELGGPAHAVY